MPTASWFIWVRNITLGGVILAFIAFFGVPSGTAPVDVVADVDGETVERDVFEFFRQQNAARVSTDQAAAADVQALRQQIDRQTLEGVLYRYVMAREASEIGLRVTDAEVRQEILANPTFRREDGRFDRELFERFVARHDLGSERVYSGELRRDLLLRKFQALVTSSVRTAESRVREDVAKALAKVRLDYVSIPTSRFEAPEALSQAEVEAFAEQERDRLEALYQTRLLEYVRPEQVRARHILFAGEEGLERAQAARERLAAGEDFGALAKELSDDEATRDQGGSLGSFPRGHMVPALEQSAFSLEPGAFSDPVETSRGIHIILVEEHSPGTERTLEEVSSELARELLTSERARDAARAEAERVVGALDGAKSLAAAAAKSGVSLETSPLFGPGQPPPELGGAPGLIQAALTLDAENPVSRQIFDAGTRYLVIALKERQEPDAGELDLQVETFLEESQQRARADLMNRWYTARRTELQRKGLLEIYPLYPGEAGSGS